MTPYEKLLEAAIAMSRQLIVLESEAEVRGLDFSIIEEYIEPEWGDLASVILASEEDLNRVIE